MMLTRKDFYFCYSNRMKKFLEQKGIEYICRGVSDTTSRTFWLYFRSPELTECLIAFKK